MGLFDWSDDNKGDSIFQRFKEEYGFGIESGREKVDKKSILKDGEVVHHSLIGGQYRIEGGDKTEKKISSKYCGSD